MPTELTRSDVEAMPGATVLEFGASWCPICQAARPLVDRALSQEPSVRQLRVEDGKGKPLGRSFGIKLWPSLIFLRDGREVTRLVRPSTPEALKAALEQLYR